MVSHNEHSIKFLQLTDLLHVLQITLADIKPDKSIKRRKHLIAKLVKALFPLNPLTTDVITFIIRETVRISKMLKTE